jgi:hypothetical protein
VILSASEGTAGDLDELSEEDTMSAALGTDVPLNMLLLKGMAGTLDGKVPPPGIAGPGAEVGAV